VSFEVDLLVRNASILTMDDQRPSAHTLAVHHGRVFALDETGLHGRIEIDAQGATVVPGFGDAHNHMACTAETFFAVSLEETRFARQACGARDIPPA